MVKLIMSGVMLRDCAVRITDIGKLEACIVMIATILHSKHTHAKRASQSSHLPADTTITNNTNRLAVKLFRHKRVLWQPLFLVLQFKQLRDAVIPELHHRQHIFCQLYRVYATRTGKSDGGIWIERLCQNAVSSS